MRKPYLQHEDAGLSRVLSGLLVDAPTSSAESARLAIEKNEIEEQLKLNARIRAGTTSGVARPILLEVPDIGMVEIISLKDEGVTPGLFWRKLDPEEDGHHLRGMIKYAKKGKVKEVVGEQAAMQLADVALEGQAQIADCFIHPAVVGDDATVVLVSTFNQRMKPMTGFAATFSDKELNHGVLTVAGEEHAEGLSAVSITGTADLLFFSYLCQDADLIGKACQNKGLVDGQLFLFDLVFQTEARRLDIGPIHHTLDALFELNAAQLQVESHYTDAQRKRFQGMPVKALDDPYRHIQVRNLSILQQVPIEQRTAAVLRLRRRYPAMHEALSSQVERYEVLVAESGEASPERGIYAEIALHYRHALSQLDRRMHDLMSAFGAVFTINEIIESDFPDDVQREPIKNYTRAREAGDVEYKDDTGRSYVLDGVAQSRVEPLDQLIISRLYLLQQLANANRYSYYSGDSRGYVLPAARLLGKDELSATIDPSRVRIARGVLNTCDVHFFIEIPKLGDSREIIDRIRRGFDALGIDAELEYDSAEHGSGLHIIIHENELSKLNDTTLQQLMAPETVAISSKRVQLNQPYIRPEESLGELPRVQQRALNFKQMQFDICKKFKGAVQARVINYFQMAHTLDVNELALDVFQKASEHGKSPFTESLVNLHKNMRYLLQLPFECRAEKLQEIINQKNRMAHLGSSMIDVTPDIFVTSSTDRLLAEVVQSPDKPAALPDRQKLSFGGGPELPRALNRFSFLRQPPRARIRREKGSLALPDGDAGVVAEHKM